jgi:hypothetical protein
VADGRHEVSGDEPFRRASDASRGTSGRADDRVAWDLETHPPVTDHAEQSTRSRGEQGPEPHGREWLKQATESGGDQAVKVVGNGVGGASRAWNPATSRGVGGLEQSSTSQAKQRYSSAFRLGLAGSAIPRIERVEGAANPTGGGGVTEHGVRAPGAGSPQELRTRSSRVSARPRAASHRSGKLGRRPLSGTRRRPG